MKKNTYYTAVGNLRTKRDAEGRCYPVIVINQKEYPVDLQEMVVWSSLCWRLCNEKELSVRYEELAVDLPYERRTLECCVSRLMTRGLVARGEGDAQFEALYNLLCDLYVVPVCERLSFRIAAFLSLVLRDGVSVRKASAIFHADRRDDWETRVMKLAGQAVLSTAELIKCVEVGATDVSTDRKLLDALYIDPDTTCDNISLLMRTVQNREPVTVAVANLYLRKQIILERV